MILRIFAWKLFFFVFVVLPLSNLSWAEQINIGSISKKPNKEIKMFLPLASYIEKQLQSEGINKVKVVIANDIYSMADFIKEGKVDLYVDSPFPSMVVSRISGSKFLLRRWKKGTSEYNSVIFVRSDSGIASLDDLKGKIIAFEEPFSSSGYFLPKMFMEMEGLEFVSKGSVYAPVDTDKVGYVFCLEGNTVPWVFRKKVTAGAMNNGYLLEDSENSMESFKIIFKTAFIPRHIVSYRADMDTKLVNNIKEILINMDRSEDGMKALQEFERTTKFDEIPQESKMLLSKSQKFIDKEFGLK